MFDINSKFKVSIEGRGTLHLGPADYVTSGGEGSVYRKNSMGIKLWSDPARATAGRMIELDIHRTREHPKPIQRDGNRIPIVRSAGRNPDESHGYTCHPKTGVRR